jgi:hypothetical protein
MLGHWIYHWVWLDFYVPVWPNIAASAVLGTAVFMKLHAMHKLHKRHFDWHKDQGKEGDHA